MPDVSVVSGKLAVVGPSSNKPDGSEYTYLRLTKNDGSTELIKKVGVGHLVESHIRPGLQGDFYFVKLGRLGQILFAVKTTAGEKIYEQDGFATWIRKMRWSAAMLALLFVPLSLVGLLMGGLLWRRSSRRVDLLYLETSGGFSPRAEGKLFARPSHRVRIW